MTIRTATFVVIFILLGIYYPVVFAGVNSLDDFRMIGEQLPSGGMSGILALFNPATFIGYFRPLIMLSFTVDNSILELTTEAIHLENILIHLANSLLVFWIGLSLFRKAERQVELAFIAACLFGLHPLHVEAVAWISGRTDLLATLFALLGLVCICRFITTERLIWLWHGAVICVIGALAKETALFCLPAFFLVAITNDQRLGDAFREKNLMPLFMRLSGMVMPFLLTGLTYLSCRLATLRIVSSAVAASPVNSVVAGNSLTTRFALLKELLTTFGFYIKKLFLPLPLNFAITAISPHYIWLGLTVILLVCHLCLIRRRNGLALQMTLACMLVMVSALIISRAGIAWTPYAERYLYLPTVFFAIGMTDCGYRFSATHISARHAQIAVFILLSFFAIVTAQRALIWQNNLTLYQDTIKKSPDFAPISNELAIALSETSRHEDALKQIEVGKKAEKHGDMVLLYVNQASVLSAQKKYDEAYKALAVTHRNIGIDAAHIEVIKSYIHIMEREQVETKDRKRAVRLLSKLADLHEIFYKRSGDTDHLYRAGQLALAGKDRKKAHRFFAEVAEKAPKESMYKGFARKMADKTGDAAGKSQGEK